MKQEHLIKVIKSDIAQLNNTHFKNIPIKIDCSDLNEREMQQIVDLAEGRGCYWRDGSTGLPVEFKEDDIYLVIRGDGQMGLLDESRFMQEDILELSPSGYLASSKDDFVDDKAGQVDGPDNVLMEFQVEQLKEKLKAIELGHGSDDGISSWPETKFEFFNIVFKDLTPEESAAIQNKAFDFGYVWIDGDTEVKGTDEPVLVLFGNKKILVAESAVKDLMPADDNYMRLSTREEFENLKSLDSFRHQEAA